MKRPSNYYYATKGNGMKQDANIKPSFNWILPAHGGHGGRGGGIGARIAIYKSGADNVQLSITLYADTMKSIRWVVGDRVQVGFDLSTNCIALRRVPSGGHALTATSVTGIKREKLQGKVASSVVKLRAPKELISHISEPIEVLPDDLIDVDGMLVLPLRPRQHAP